MADSRSVRSASRRKTPTPQPPSKANTPQPARASRTRALRSASRDVEAVDTLKPTRRSARQASVTIVTDGSEDEGHSMRKSKRRPVKEAMGDLTVVEELDTQLDIQEAPGTPPRTQPENQIPTQSPGAASQMSGTTAISSFSMAEAESLEPKYILKHLQKLHDAAGEFLRHIVPEEGSNSEEHDKQHVKDMQMPDSEFTEDYRTFDTVLRAYLGFYKTDDNDYIRPGAIHLALFGANQEAAATRTGLDLILYLANILIFGKEMIYSDRSNKDMWDNLRTLDLTFPSQFVPAIIPDTRSTSAGESALLEETFALALELRTQLAILVLEKAVEDEGLDPHEQLREVFFRSETSQEAGGSVVKGWNASKLGGADTALPKRFQDQIDHRYNEIRKYLPMNDASQGQGDVGDLDELSHDFPWLDTVLLLLQWVRLRHRELHGTIEELGGPTKILQNIKRAMEEPQDLPEQAKAASVPHNTPRRKRASFERNRKRSSRSFDPNTPVDVEAIDALKARERLSEVNARQVREQQLAQQVVEGAAEAETVGALGARNRRSNGLSQTMDEDVQSHVPIVVGGHDDHQPAIGGDEMEQLVEHLEEQLEDRLREHTAEQNEEDEQLAPTNPPISSAALLKVLKEVSKPGKENRKVSIFDRQPNAQRVEFGDGFDTQPTPGPSTQSKGKQPAQASPSRKRPRPVEIDIESEDDDFESEDRTARAQIRRQKAPVTKKVRIDPKSSQIPESSKFPTSSKIPTSAQPPRRSQDVDDDYQPARDQEESISENEAPDMTEEPPPSSYKAQLLLAKQNYDVLASQRDRRPRTDWSDEEVEAFMNYMSMFPCKFARIKAHDKQTGGDILRHRTQVNLKDKARTMATNMIKSGTGLRDGFENVISPTSKFGEALYAQGWRW